MVRVQRALLGLGLCLLPLSEGIPQGTDGLMVSAVRFYRADQQTRVKAFVRIPYLLMAPASPPAAPQLTYRVAVRVLDAQGATRLEEGWTSRAPVELAQPGVYALEILEFAVPAGKYRLEVTVEDSATARQHRVGTEVEGFAEPPPASDLLLAPEMRLAAAQDTVPKAGELRMGQTLITAAAQLHITPLRSQVYYLLEAYADRELTGSLVVAVMDAGGRTLLQTPPQAVSLYAGGGVLKGQLDMAGLPAGQYDLVATLTVGDRKTERRARFTMAALQETLAREAARQEAELETDEGYFAAMNEAELDSAYAPLVYIAQADDHFSSFGDLSLDARRRFLTRFWQRRDPTPGTPKNEAREAYYAGVAHANEAFKEGGRRATPGWKSDRGRVYARNGAPDDVLRRTQSGRAPPYEVWRYTRGKTRYYIFADRTGFGAYTLLHSNDLQESTKPGWMEILTDDAVIDAGRWLGVSFVPSGGRIDFGSPPN